MNKITKILTYVLVFILVPCIVLFSACGKKSTQESDTNATTSESITGESPDSADRTTEKTETEKTVATNVSDAKAVIDAVSITSSQMETTKPADATEITASTTISVAGSYYISGTIASILVETSKDLGDVHIYLDNANLSNENKNVISAKSGTNLIITLIGTNTLTTTNTSSAEHAIKGKGNITINGQGFLTINSAKSGIGLDGAFYGLGGTINIAAVNHGISADRIYLNGSAVNITSCGKDGLHAESDYDDLKSNVTAPTFDYNLGYVYITGDTKLTISGCKGDGIQADSFVYITGGTIDITTIATFVSYSEKSTYSLEDDDYKYTKSGSTYAKVASDEITTSSSGAGNGRMGGGMARYSISSLYAMIQSAKGIKVGAIDYNYKNSSSVEVVSENYLIYISGGNITINSSDDAIHTNSGNVEIAGGTITTSTLDDGVHADLNLIISGGTTTISSSYEGFEGRTITIVGGTNTIKATDDGMNAADSTLSSSSQQIQCYIYIDGGINYVYASGDGVDSNGNIYMYSGFLGIRGPSNNGNESIDSGDGRTNGVQIKGGTLVSLGASGGNGPMANSSNITFSQAYIKATISASNTSGNITISDTSGNTLFTYPVYDLFGSLAYSGSVELIISSSKLTSSTSYNIKIGSYSTTVKCS